MLLFCIRKGISLGLFGIILSNIIFLYMTNSIQFGSHTLSYDPNSNRWDVSNELDTPGIRRGVESAYGVFFDELKNVENIIDYEVAISYIHNELSLQEFRSYILLSLSSLEENEMQYAYLKAYAIALNMIYA